MTSQIASRVGDSPEAESSTNEVILGDFRRYYPFTPTALTIRECVRLAAMHRLSCPGPILDVGCGDGLFAKLAFEQADIWGIDVDAGESRRAQASHAYSKIIVGDVSGVRLPESFFGSCVANCSLEHVSDLPSALLNIRRALKAGGLLYAFLPHRDWAEHLLSATLLTKLGLEAASASLQRAINAVFRHHHLEDLPGWQRKFEQAGFRVTLAEPIGTTASIRAFEAFLLPSLLGLMNRKVTGRWILFPGLRRLTVRPIHAAVQALLAAGKPGPPTAEVLICAER